MFASISNVGRSSCRLVGDQQRCSAATDKKPVLENRVQQLGRIRQQLKIRIGHDSTLAYAPNRVRPDSALARAHPGSRLPVPEAGRERRWRQQFRFLVAWLLTKSECPSSLRHVRREMHTSSHGLEILPGRKYWVCPSAPDHTEAGKFDPS